MSTKVKYNGAPDPGYHLPVPERRKPSFKCQTVSQFRLCAWLAEQGVERDDIADVEFPGPDTVKVTNPAGQYMVIHWRDGRAVIDTEPE